jgi:parallel beta-helix repeat protein
VTSNNILSNGIPSEYEVFGGIWLGDDANCTISSNNIVESIGAAVVIVDASNNAFFHNNFINNTEELQNWYGGFINTWDDGYPSGGNYWSSYAGFDTKNGPSQDLPGSDGIGDQPYELDADNVDQYPLMSPRAIGWRDIGISGVNKSKTVVGEGQSMNVSLEVRNLGMQLETFNVTVKANLTTIYAQAITLAAGNSTTVLFTWKTTGVSKGNYTLIATADTVPDEVDITNNILADGWIAVTISGDLNGDFKVGPADFALLSVAYGSSLGKPKWNANCDINNDGKVGPADFAQLSAHYGQHYP